MEPITLAIAIASLPLLYIVQASIDARFERRERAEHKANKRARIIIKRSKGLLFSTCFRKIVHTDLIAQGCSRGQIMGKF
ncbi:MAG: hypothetical protein IIA36_10515 [Proteobacteria bacterium]|nr:hypothetical protein [Pseudomonadota bacterium]